MAVRRNKPPALRGKAISTSEHRPGRRGRGTAIASKSLFSTGNRRGGYDGATAPTDRRRQPGRRLRSEDDVLGADDRKKVISTARDMQRNFAAAAWVIREHLKFVSRFTFQAKTDDKGQNKAIEELMTWWSHPENCDVAGRHTLASIITLAEGRRTVDGDVFLMKLNSGRIQPIEGDRICTPRRNTPPGFDPKKYTQGVRTTKGGRATQYVVCKRAPTGTGADVVYERTIRAQNIIAHGYYDRFDQIRGISPLAAALTTFTDLYQGLDYALAKMKVAQMFGLFIFRDGDTPVGPVTSTDDEGTETTDDDKYEVDFGGGPIFMDLEAGDKAEFLEAKTPSVETQAFVNIMLAIGFKSLDIPFSFYDESFTNYYGQRGAWLRYVDGAKIKRAGNQEVLRKLTGWRFAMWEGQDELPLKAGQTAADLRYQWVPTGLPWWNPLQEVKADLLAIEGKLTSRTAVLRAQGRDFVDVVDELAFEEGYIDEQLGSGEPDATNTTEESPNA